MKMRWLSLMIGVLALAATGSARAAEPAQIDLVFTAELWALNGDLVRQPNVPIVQKLAVPPINVSDTVMVTPSKASVTRIGNFPAGFGGGATITFSRTTGGQRVLVAKPTDRFNPFTAMFNNVVGNDAGTVMFNPADMSWSAEVPVNLTSAVDLDIIQTEVRTFFLDLTLNGAIGISGGTAPVVGSVTYIGVPVTGTLRGDKFTTKTVTVMKEVITSRLFSDPNGTPSGYQTFTFTAMGSVTPNKLTLVTPIVIDALAGVGDQQVPVPIIGFAKSVATGPGVTLATPEPGLFLLAGGALALGLVSRRRRNHTT